MLPVVISIAALLAACFALAWLLELTTDVPLLDAYLATTPGGLYAVLPIAYGSGADTTFVLAVQGLRLFAMVLAAPAVVRWLVRPEGGGSASPPRPAGPPRGPSGPPSERPSPP